MTRRAITSPRAPSPVGAYSHAIMARGTVYVSAQGPYDPLTGAVLGEDIVAQTEQTINNIEAILAEAGCGLENVVRVDANLASMSLFDDYDATYRRRFPQPAPARSTVGSELGGILITLACVAITTT